MTLVTDAPALENDTMRIALRNHENFEDVLFALALKLDKLLAVLCLWQS